MGGGMSTLNADTVPLKSNLLKRLFAKGGGLLSTFSQRFKPF